MLPGLSRTRQNQDSMHRKRRRSAAVSMLRGLLCLPKVSDHPRSSPFCGVSHQVPAVPRVLQDPQGYQDRQGCRDHPGLASYPERPESE